MSHSYRFAVAVLAMSLLGASRSAWAEHGCPGKLSPELETIVDQAQHENSLFDVVIRVLVAPNDPAYADVEAIAAAAPTKVEKVKRVYNAIRYEADTVQSRAPCGGRSIRRTLADGVGAGTAAPGWKPHWLGNEIAAQAKPALVRALCARPDVARIALASGGQKPMTTAPDPVAPTWNIDRIDADYAWIRNVTGRGAIVGVIDTGANLNHQDLRSECKGGVGDGFSCIGTGSADACDSIGGVCLGPLVNRTTGQPYWKDVTPTAAATPIDDLGHGTFMLGVAVGRNGVGVAPEANWIACRAVMNSGGFPFYQTEDWLTECAEFLINPDNVALMGDQHAANAADVILLPYALGEVRDDAAACDSLKGFQQKVARMRAMDILPVFPVGNDPSFASGSIGVPVPANYRPALAVGLSLDSETYTPPAGTDPMDPSSHRGSILCLDDLTSTSTRAAPALVAPGRGVRAPWMPTPCPLDPSQTCVSTYQTLSGADVAAAHVAGAAAALRALNPDLSAQRSPLFLDSRFFALDEVLKRRAFNYVEAPFRAGRLDLRAVLQDFASPSTVTTPFPSPFYTSEPGIPNTQNVSVAMRNWSPYTWTPTNPPNSQPGLQGPMRLADAAYPTDTWRVGTVALPATKPTVKPGEEVTFAFAATAPDTLSDGYQYKDYAFQFQMKRAANFGEATPSRQIRVSGRDRALPGSISPALAEVPASPCRTVNVRMTNSGTTTWTPALPGMSTYRAYWRLFQPNGVTLISSGTVNVSGAVPPGAAYDFPVSLCAPVADGTYPFRLQVQRDGGALSLGTELQSSMPVTNAAVLDPGTNPNWVWEWAPGYPTIHWRVVLKNTGNRVWDGNYCVKETHGRGWPSGALPVAPRCLGGGSDVVAPNTARAFDGYLSVEAAPYGAWNYTLRMFRPDGVPFGPSATGFVSRPWTFGAAWNPGVQGYKDWFFGAVSLPCCNGWLDWRASQGRWEWWDGNSWENPWVDATAVRPGAAAGASRYWKSPTDGYARARVVFRNPNNNSGGCPNEGSVSVYIEHYRPDGSLVTFWYPNTADGPRLRNGQSATVDTADAVGTTGPNGAHPNGFWVNRGDFIGTGVGEWDNLECDKTFDNEPSNPLQISIWQATAETPTVVPY